MSEPTMVYKSPGKHKIHGGNYDYKIVNAVAEDGKASELDEALSEGWFKTTKEASDGVPLDGETADGVPLDDEAPTREELETKAAELKISFQKNTSNAALLKKIEKALHKD
jgi:hypothetical protein